MQDHVYKKVELTGSSTTGLEDAVNNALLRASKSIHGLKWFEVGEIRGDVADGKAEHWQVSIKVGFTLDE